MKHRITSTDVRSPAARAGIKQGQFLIGIDESPVWDVIDYEQLTAKEELLLKIETEEGNIKQIRIRKELYEPLGLNFESSLMSPIRQCSNHCIFCFIDQMPHGNRKTLYFKDDDWRLSLIMGNYVTLTNVGEKEFERIISRRVSPLYISVHATNGEVRKQMMRSKNAEQILERLVRLHEEGLRFHCQIVLCPGYNDGAVLEQTLNDLYALMPECRSVAIVPVGLTAHRERLTDIAPVTAEIARTIITQIEAFKRRHSLSGFAYASDEMYLRAEMELPSYEECGDFEQIENGVGLYRKFEYEFNSALSDLCVQDRKYEFDSVSGVSIAPLMQKLFDKLLPFNIKINVHPIINDFFGRSITVSGLTTARDIIAQLSSTPGSSALLLPHTMLRENDIVFLDGMTTEALSNEINLPVFKLSADDGFDFIDDLTNIITNLKG